MKTLHKNIMTACFATMFAIGLASCGGGGDTPPSTSMLQPVDPDPDMDTDIAEAMASERAAIDLAITEVRDAVALVTSEDEYTNEQFVEAEEKIEAAEEAISNAENIPAEEKNANRQTVSALQTLLSNNKESKMIAEADLLYRAIGTYPLRSLDTVTLNKSGLLVSTDNNVTTDDVTLKSG